MYNRTFLESGILLKKEDLLFLYGPFKKLGKYTSQSYLMFDYSLTEQNSDRGLRDLDEV